MKIRVINENDWEKAYDIDKTIIRIGSQPNCDIQLKGSGIQPLQLQLIHNSGNKIGYVMRIFADNVILSRGMQSFTGKKMVPYEVLDGDKITIGSFRLVISLGDEKSRVRKSAHIEAEMNLAKRDLSLDSPIIGVLELRNIGTEKACQFRMHISGIPDECLKSSPLPLLYPGGSSSVGFVISHLRTKPEPGFHTVSITLNASEEYMGEVLEFNQDIYVEPVFQNEFILEDDAAELSGFKQISGDNKPVAPSELNIQAMVPDSSLLNKDRITSELEPSEDVHTAPVVIKKGKAFDDEELDTLKSASDRPHKKKKNAPIVIRHDEKAFGDEKPEEKPVMDDFDLAGNSSDSEPVHEPKTVSTVLAPKKKEISDSAMNNNNEFEKSNSEEYYVPKRRKKTEKPQKTVEIHDPANVIAKDLEKPLSENKPLRDESKTVELQDKPESSHKVELSETDELNAAESKDKAKNSQKVEPSESVAPSEVEPMEKLDDSKKTELSEFDQLKIVEMIDKLNELEKRGSLKKNESKVNESADQSGISELPESFTADEVVKVVKESEPSAHELFSDETGLIEKITDKESGPEENEQSEELTDELTSDIIEVQKEFGQDKNPETAIPNPAENTPSQPVQEELLSKTMGLIEKQKELLQAQKMEELEETPPMKTSDTKNLSGFFIHTGKTDESADVQSPIIYSSHSMDFSDDSERDESSQKKDPNPVVRFVKGGSFDD